jgi:hypothetical protein
MAVPFRFLTVQFNVAFGLLLLVFEAHTTHPDPDHIWGHGVGSKSSVLSTSMEHGKPCTEKLYTVIDRCGKNVSIIIWMSVQHKSVDDVRVKKRRTKRHRRMAWTVRKKNISLQKYDPTIQMTVPAVNGIAWASD